MDDLDEMSKSLYLTMEFCVKETQSYFNILGEWLIRQPWFQAFLLNALCAYSRMALAVEKWARTWFPATSQVPSRWMSMSTVDKTTFEFSEVYLPTNSSGGLVHGHVDESAYYDYVWMSKMDEKSPYINVRCNQDHGTTRAIEPSKTRFLSVSYCHPDVPDKISIEIPTSMMVVDNEILSPAFVRRNLPASTLFDDRYSIECIDNQIQFLRLTADEYIVLTSDGWSRVKRATASARRSCSEEE